MYNLSYSAIEFCFLYFSGILVALVYRGQMSNYMIKIVANIIKEHDIK